MLAFKNNTDAALTNTANAPLLSFKEGQQIDYIKVFNQSHKVGTWEYVIDRNEVFWSREVYEIYGLPPGKGPIDLKRAIQSYDPEDAKKLSELMQQAVALRCGFRCKLRLRRPDGQYRMTESNAAPVLDDSGRLTRLIGTFRDVTSQTEYENLRKGQQDLLVRTIRCLPIAVALLDQSFRYVAWSERWISDLNMPEGVDYLGLDHREVLPDLAQMQQHHLAMALRGTPVGKDNDRFQRANGAVYITDWRIQPWRDKTGDVGGVLVMMHVKYVAAPRLDERARRSGAPDPGRLALTRSA